MKLKYLICLLSGITFAAMSASIFAQEVKPVTPPEKKECTTNVHCRATQICFQNRCMTKTQSKTIKTNANNLIIPGAVLTAVGGASLIIGGALLGVGYDEDYDNGDDFFYIPPELVAGWGLIFIGGASFITGAILLPIGLVKRKKMERNKLAFDIRTKHGKLTLEPTYAAGENGGVFGLVGRF